MTGAGDIPAWAWAWQFVPAFEQVKAALELADGFILIPIEVPGPDVTEALHDWLRHQGQSPALLAPRTAKDWLDVAFSLQFSRPHSAVLVSGGPEPPQDRARGLGRLNQQRDVIARSMQRPLLWCGTAEFLTETWMAAPDFWSIATVPIRLEANLTSQDPFVDHRLGAFLHTRMSPEEIRRLIQLRLDPTLARALPPRGVSSEKFVADVIALIRRHGVMDRFLAALRQTRPRHAAELDRINDPDTPRQAPEAPGPSAAIRSLSLADTMREILARPGSATITVVLGGDNPGFSEFLHALVEQGGYSPIRIDLRAEAPVDPSQLVGSVVLVDAGDHGAYRPLPAKAVDDAVRSHLVAAIQQTSGSIADLLIPLSVDIPGFQAHGSTVTALLDSMVPFVVNRAAATAPMYLKALNGALERVAQDIGAIRRRFFWPS